VENANAGREIPLALLAARPIRSSKRAALPASRLGVRAAPTASTVLEPLRGSSAASLPEP